jgi:hypothetical protein
MVGSTTTTYTDALKFYQQEYIERTQNLYPMLLNLMPMGEEGIVGGLGWQPSFNIQQNESVSAIFEEDDLPVAQSTNHEKALIEPKIYASRIRLTGKLLAIAKNNRQAYANAEIREFKSALMAMRKAINRNSFEDGNAKLATVLTGATSTTIKVDTILSTSRLANGMVVDFFLGTTLEDTATIIKIDDQAAGGPEIELDASVTVSTAAQIVRSGIRGTGSDQKAVIGLDAVFDNSSDYYGLDRTSGTATTNFNSQVFNVAGNLTEESMFLIEDRVLRQDPMPVMRKVIISERSQQRQYFQLLKTARRFVDPTNYYGGYTSVSHLGFDWLVDDDCARDVLYFLCLDHWRRYSIDGDIHLASKDGLRLRHVTDKDAWESYLIYYGNIACLHPRLQGKLTGLTIPAV